MKSCFSLWHREVPEAGREALDDASEQHITEYSVTGFFADHCRGDRYMFACCDHLIACVWRPAGNARDLGYAWK